jgi:hypothetical protein
MIDDDASEAVGGIKLAEETEVLGENLHQCHSLSITNTHMT